MPYRRHSNRQGSGVASEYSKAGIDTFWKIPFKNNYIYVRPEYLCMAKMRLEIHDSCICAQYAVGIPDTEEGNERYSHYLPWETPHDFVEECGLKKIIKYTESSETF